MSNFHIDTLDIVALVKDNPLNRLQHCDNGILVNKIKERFTEDDQKFFLANFYCYLNYDISEKSTDFVIELDKVWRWLGFSRIDHAKELLKNHFVKNTNYIIEKPAPAIAEPMVGGHNREFTKMNIYCFKEFCLLSRSKKSKEIRKYYINLENIVNEVVNEQAEYLRNQLQIKDNQLKLKDKDFQNNLMINFKNKQVVYLVRIEENVVKFGYSKNIQQRMDDHMNEFGKDIVLFSIFDTIYNREFETMLKSDPVISKYIIKKIYKTNQTELIQLDENFTTKDLNERIEILKENIIGDLVDNLIKENNELKIKLAEYEIKDKTLEIKDKNLVINDFTKPPPAVKENKHQDRVQLYDTTLKLVKTFETIEAACNERELYRDAIPQSICRSAKNNTIYKGYRFWKIRFNEPIIEYEIPTTVELSKEQTHQRIVQFTRDGNIVGVFSCTKMAAENLHKLIQSKSIVLKNKKLYNSTLEQINKSITNSLSIHTNHISYDHCWYRESDIPEHLMQTFTNYKSNNILPPVVINKNNKTVGKYDENDTLIHVYDSITQARKAENLSEKIINKYIAEKTMHNSHYFSFE